MIITHLGRYIKYCYKICFYSSIYFYLHIRVYFFLSLNKGQIVLSVVRNDAEWVLFGAVSGRIEPTVELIHCSHRTVYTTVTMQVTRSASTPGESMITVTGGSKRPTTKWKQAERCPVQLWVIKHSEFALHIRWKRLNLLSLRLTAKHFYTIRNKLLAFLFYNGLICRVQYSTCLTSLCLYSGLLTHKNRVWYTIHTFSHAVWRHANPRKGCNLAVTEWVKMYTYRQTLNSRVSVPLNIFYTIWLTKSKKLG